MSTEAPRRGASHEYPQYMFLLRNKKDISFFQMKKEPYLLLCHNICFYGGIRIIYIYYPRMIIRYSSLISHVVSLLETCL